MVLMQFLYNVYFEVSSINLIYYSRWQILTAISPTVNKSYIPIDTIKRISSLKAKFLFITIIVLWTLYVYISRSLLLNRWAVDLISEEWHLIRDPLVRRLEGRHNVRIRSLLSNLEYESGFYWKVLNHLWLKWRVSISSSLFYRVTRLTYSQCERCITRNINVWDRKQLNASYRHMQNATNYSATTIFYTHLYITNGDCWLFARKLVLDLRCSGEIRNHIGLD